MDLLRLIDEYAAYDLWANTRILARLSREPETILDLHVKSSFPSLRATLMHIRDAENAWRQRMSGEPQQWPAEESSSTDTFLPHVTRIRDFVRSLTLEQLMGEAVYADLRGNEHRQPRYQALMHCFNHSTYHRGQLVTMMRQLDLGDIPALDLIAYQRLAAQGKA